jgi:gliding motility associated protien GldN
MQKGGFMKSLKMKLMAAAAFFFTFSKAQYPVYQAGGVTEIYAGADEYSQITGWLAEYDPYSPSYETVPEFPKTRVPAQPMWEYPALREADVSWMTRYERIIDTRQKMNQVLRYPKLSLLDLLLKSGLNESVIAYRDRDFQQPMNPYELKELLTIAGTTDIPDPNDPSQIISIPVHESISRDKIVKFRLMEDWLFDKKHSRMICRIVAIAPLYRPVVANGQVELPEQPLCWFRYEDLRPVFIHAEVFNRNLASRISMDHFFQARMFDSYIVREPNVYDYDISHFPEYENNGLAALLKGEEIKNDLFVMEHDLWEY